MVKDVTSKNIYIYIYDVQVFANTLYKVEPALTKSSKDITGYIRWDSSGILKTLRPFKRNRMKNTQPSENYSRTDKS